MDREVRTLQREVSQLARSGRRGRRDYPGELRARIILCAQRHVRAGTSVARLALALGVPLSTLTVWTGGGAPPGAATTVDFREVHLSAAALSGKKPETAGPIVLVTPQGFRVEGLRVAELAELFRALS